MHTKSVPVHFRFALLAAAALLWLPSDGGAQVKYEHPETRELVNLVNDAADLVRSQGDAAFTEFAKPGSRWRHEEKYVFVLDPRGQMIVHPDPELQGKNEIDLKDVNGKPIIRGLIGAATASPKKPAGWYHYQWPEPEGLLPRWKSSFVRLVQTRSGEKYIVGSGMYNDEMERAFVVDAVTNAVAEIERQGKSAFEHLRDPKGPYIFKDAYVFVDDPSGVELVNPAFPSLEGRNIIDVKDTDGKALVREMLDMVRTRGSGWVEYMWPKPGESVSTRKSAYVSKAKLGDKWVLVGAGVYLADAPKAVAEEPTMKAPELMSLVRDAAREFEKSGEKAYPQFRKQGTKWFHGETYFFVWSMDGKRVFHAANPASEGEDVRELKDALGRPIGKMFIAAAASEKGEGWVHYTWPEPGKIFPIWKSSFKQVTYPSGKQYLVGCGVYNMDMDKSFIVDVVDRASALVAAQGEAAFDELRDKTGPYMFLDTYVFVDDPQGVELVNPGLPSLQGKNLSELKDVNGKYIVRDYIAAAMEKGSAWVDYFGYRPGENTPARKLTYVKKVVHDGDTYVVGSGFYPREAKKPGEVSATSWGKVEKVKLSDGLTRQAVSGDKGTLAKFTVKRGAGAQRHGHPSEEYALITKGSMVFKFDDREIAVKAGDVLVIPPHTPHAVTTLADAEFVEYFTPVRADWLRGENAYLQGGVSSDVVPLEAGRASQVRKTSLSEMPKEKISGTLTRQMVSGERATFAYATAKPGVLAPRHKNPHEEYTLVTDGALKITFDDDREVVARNGDIVIIPANVPHAFEAMEQGATFFDIFTPRRDDWLRGEDAYLRQSKAE